MRTKTEIKDTIGGLRNLYMIFGSGEVYTALSNVERTLEWVLGE